MRGQNRWVGSTTSNSEAMPQDKIKPPRGLMFSVLRTVHFLGLNAAGTDVRQFLAEQTGDEDLEAALIYGTLRRLEQKGFVTASDEKVRPAGRKGRPRRIYSLTVTGLRALEAGSKLYALPVTQAGYPGNVEEDDQATGMV